MTGRAKWDAWDAAGKKYNVSREAEIRYLDIARSLGWSESVGDESPTDSEDVDLEHLSDGEDAPAKTAAAGLGLSVSSMPRPKVATDKTLHGMVLACDVPGLVSLLDKLPNMDLNALDEYVSFATWRIYINILICFGEGICSSSSCMRPRSFGSRKTPTL